MQAFPSGQTNEGIAKHAQLIAAINASNVDQVRQLLQSNYEQVINKPEPVNRQTPIYSACMTQVPQDVGYRICEILLQKGADPTIKDANRQSIIYYLAKDGKTSILRLVLSRFKFNLNENDFNEQTPIYYAARENRLEALAYLVEMGADVNHKDSNNQTCLYYACRSPAHLEIVKKIVELGVQIGHVDKYRLTAEKHAQRTALREIADFLKKTLASQNKQRQMEQFKEKQSSINQTANNNNNPSKSNTGGNAKKKTVAASKRETTKYEYCIIYTDQQGQSHQLTEAELEDFKNNHQRMWTLLSKPELLQNEPQPTERRFEKNASKIMNHFWKHQYGANFWQPVDYVKFNIPDYPKVVKNPMDFGTIKIKLSNNVYESFEAFVADMMLVFDNCILYNGTTINEVGKAALAMKLELNSMLQDMANSREPPI